jgi:hypothetical protein
MFFGGEMTEDLRENTEPEISPSAETIAAWTSLSPQLAALEEIGRNGTYVIVKVDGLRTGVNVYTVVISGGPLEEDPYRKDGPDLGKLIREGIRFFSDKMGQLKRGDA